MKNQSFQIRFEYAAASPLPKDGVLVSFVPKEYDEVIVDASGRRTYAIGIGSKKMTRRSFITLARKLVTSGRGHRIKQLVVAIADIHALAFENPIPAEDLFELFATNAVMANYEFNQYKSEPKGGWNRIESITFVGDRKEFAPIQQAVVKGELVGTFVNECRTLANTPGGEMTPSILAAKAKAMLSGTDVKLSVLGIKEIEKLGMGGVLGVSRGSDEEPKFLVMEYFGAGKPKGKKGEAPIVLVGKGVTFDSGGLNLKPTEGIYEMHMDMSGGAAVLSALAVAAKLKIKKNIVGLVPAVENMPSGSSYRPGDLLKTMSGKTIEVLNTDAEGRIILADALTYAKKYNPRLVVDVATLTGASMMALGQRASALFTKDRDLEKLFRDLGEQSGDYVWPLPLWDEYHKDIATTFGDIANMGKNRLGGAITGAIFLSVFAEGYPWVHIDMAPRMVAVEGDYLAKGAAGEPVRLLV